MYRQVEIVQDESLVNSTPALREGHLNSGFTDCNTLSSKSTYYFSKILRMMLEPQRHKMAELDYF